MKKDFLDKKYLKYLPSKKFIIIISSIIFVLAVSASVLFFTASKKENFAAGEIKNSTALQVSGQTVTGLTQNDADGDGIYDWEETLWGTDKNKPATFGSAPDAIYIENKRRELKVEDSVNITKLTETEKFAREFFSSFAAMTTSGQVDANTINSFSNALGQKIVNPVLVDRFVEHEVKVINNNNQTQKQKYYAAVQELFMSYEQAGIGDELDIVNSGLATYETTTKAGSYDKLPVIAKAYQDFAEKIMTLNVPSDLVVYHLEIANNANNTGLSVFNMGEIIRDPLVGLEGISQYQKYSEDLIKAVGDLETALTQE